MNWSRFNSGAFAADAAPGTAVPNLGTLSLCLSTLLWGSGALGGLWALLARCWLLPGLPGRYLDTWWVQAQVFS